MKRVARVIGTLLLAWIIYRPITHFLCLPGAVRASWVQALATTGTDYRGHDELPTFGKEARTVYANAEPVFKASDQKRRLYSIFKSGTGKMGLRRRTSTVEGNPIVMWLLVQDGKVTYVEDCSRDDGAPPWAVYKRTPLEFKLGFMRDHEFVEGEPGPTDSPVIVLEMKVPNKLIRMRNIDTARFY